MTFSFDFCISVIVQNNVISGGAFPCTLYFTSRSYRTVRLRGGRGCATMEMLPWSGPGGSARDESPREESPSITGRDNCYRQPGATPGKVQQRDTAGRTCLARVERRGKSSPAHWRLCGHVNPIRCNTEKRAANTRRPAGAVRKVAGPVRRRAGKIDCRPRQNSAYRPGLWKRGINPAFFCRIFLFFLMPYRKKFFYAVSGLAFGTKIW